MLAAALAACTVLGEHAAHAAPPEQKAAAQRLFERGRELALQKNFAEACPKFAESLRLDTGLGTMLWLADCLENNGQTASAWAEFKEAASTAAASKDPREAVARRRADALEPKLSTMLIAVSASANVPGLEIRRDGVLVSGGAFGQALPVDPGVHAVSAAAPGRLPWNANIDVPTDRAAPLVVNIPALVVAPMAATDAPGHEAAPEPPPPTSSEWSTGRILGVSAAAVGVVGLGLGTVFGLRAKSALDDSNANGHCLPDNECDATGKQRRDDASSSATLSTVSFVAGGVLVAGGAILFFTSPRSKRPVSLSPVVTWQSAGAAVTGTF